MINPPSTAAVDPNRIVKLVRMLSSDRPCEADAAAAAPNRTGKDIHYLADILEYALPQQQPTLFPLTAMAPRRSPRGAPLKIGDRVVCHEDNDIFRVCKCGIERERKQRANVRRLLERGSR